MLTRKSNQALKIEHNTIVITYRNLLCKLLKGSKQIYFVKYFERKWNNFKERHLERSQNVI